MTDMFPLLLLLPLLGCLFVLFAKKNDNNSFHVVLFTLLSNLAIIVRLLTQIHRDNNDLQSFHFSYPWLESKGIELAMEANLFSLLVLLGIYVAFIIAVVGLLPQQRKNKSQMLLGLYFIWNITGLLCSNDMVSFYIFFAGMLIPLFLLIGLYGNIKKNSTLYLFFAFNYAGILCLLTAMLFVYKYHQGNVELQDIALIKMPVGSAMVVWTSVCMAFISRIPIWPFHYWISSINSGLRSSLVCVMTNMLPLTGLYGFLRFWQITIPKGILPFVPVVEIFGIMTMLFIALIGLSHKDFLQKLFSYNTVYYLLFLLTTIMLPEGYIINIAYSLITFLIINASLTVLDLWAENSCEENNCDYRGILAYMPRLAIIFAFFVLVAVGLPLSAMFWNNFVLISAFFRVSFTHGLLMMTAIAIISMALLYELFIMRDTSNKNPILEIEDISDKKVTFFVAVIIFLFMSFFNPLWFAF
ncbi:MAG: hypothetical protein IJ532_04120 [Alphaproteobacteria bacterium]|nr:hypothetical protein [Alphaproteobacteria bacterium]